MSSVIGSNLYLKYSYSNGQKEDRCFSETFHEPCSFACERKNLPIWTNIDNNTNTKYFIEVILLFVE